MKKLFSRKIYEKVAIPDNMRYVHLLALDVELPEELPGVLGEGGAPRPGQVVRWTGGLVGR